MIWAGLCAGATLAGAQAEGPDGVVHARVRASMPAQSAPMQESTRRSDPQGAPASSKVLSSVGPTPESVTPSSRSGLRSMLDEPPTPARIQLSGDQLTISATNASLSEVIRQVAAQTGMQVEGNSRDERVFGSYGPGSPPDVLSALLYDSGYNVVMVGSMADGAPRRLVLSTRAAAATTTQGAVPVQRSGEEDDEEPVAEVPPSQPNIAPIAAPGMPPGAGQPRTPQQMLEELQRMRQGQQQPDGPHE